MTKRIGSFQSVVRGVSEQAPHNRLDGQQWAQDNFISDPVRGLARRHGSIMKDEKVVTGALSDETFTDLQRFGEQAIEVQGTAYSMYFRKTTKVSGSIADAVYGINRTSRKILDVVTSASDTHIDAALQAGIQAVTSVGRMVVMASSGLPTTYTAPSPWSNTANQTVVWVRGGGYDRKFSIDVQLPVLATPGTWVAVHAEYTTKKSYYGGVLDTSSIATSDPDYVKKVTDIQSAYQTAVNQWIADAAADINPSNIASKLAAALITAGGLVGADTSGISTYLSHIKIPNGKSVSVNDSGDGSMLAATGEIIRNLSELTDFHFYNKVTKVQPKGTSSVGYFLKATAKDGSTGSGFGEVIWREAAGQEVIPERIFILGVIVSDTLYLATDVTTLGTLSGVAGLPNYGRSLSGDLDSSPVPAFFTRPISHLTVIQDRLVVVSGATVSMSASGDYFNFFRESVLQLKDNDPIEVYARGAEDDTITYSALLDGMFVFFGNRFQYGISGREVLKPSTAYMPVVGTLEDTNNTSPASTSDSIVFTQTRNNRLTVQQMRTGAYEGTLKPNELSLALDGYLSGNVIQVLALSAPSSLFIRTTDLPNGVFTYWSLDAGNGERVQEAWSRWVWDPSLGATVGLSTIEGSVLSLMLRDGVGATYLVLDEFERSGAISYNPYMDSQRHYTTVGSIGLGWSGEAATVCAFTQKSTDRYMIGRTLTDLSVLTTSYPDDLDALNVGVLYSSSVDITAPTVKDYQGNPVLSGRLTLTSYAVTVSNSAAMQAFVSRDGTLSMVEDWVYRPLGSWSLNEQDIAALETITVFIMEDSIKHRCILKSRGWLPLTITSLEWEGQYFAPRGVRR